MSSAGPVKKQEPWTEEQKAIIAKKEADIERLHKDITSLAKPLLTAAITEDWSKHVTPGTLSVFQEENSWDTIAANSESIILKHSSSPSLKQEVSQNTTWEKIMDAYDERLSDEEEEDDSISVKETESRTPPKAQFDPKDTKTYGTRLMEEEPVVVTCKTCQRPILISSFNTHSETCGFTGIKKPRALTQETKDANKRRLTNGIFSDEEDEDSDTRQKKSNMSEDTDGHVPAKRPPSNGVESISNKKKQPSKKEKPKLKGPKPKAPLDLDRQCGVIQGPNNTPCTRSLTCKSHSMGSKRAVAGRSQPYDILLAAYQKKSIGRPQSSAIERKGGTTIAIKSKLSQVTSLALTAADGNDVNKDQQKQSVNSDDEVENVMQAIHSSHPQPMAVKPINFVRRRRQCYRLRDILLETLTPKHHLERTGQQHLHQDTIL